LKKKSSKKRKVLIIVAVLLAGVLFGTAAFGYVYITRDTQNEPTPGTNSSAENLSPSAKLDNRVSFLLIGADKRPGDSSFNADTLIVASVDPDTKIISMLSVPRDTRVTLPGSSSFVKINSVPMYRGIGELVNQVSDLTGIPLDGYVLTNFEGFKSIIDTLGGVTIYVEKDMGPYYTGDKVDGLIYLKKGEQSMTGSEALQYARFRGDATADIGRTARQQNMLKAVAKEMLQTSTITKLPKLIPQMMDVVETDLKLMDMLKLSKVAASFESSNIISLTLPGVGLYLDNLSYWEVNRDQAKDVAQNLLLGITTDRVIDNMVMDLLDPEIRAHITVPGSFRDPNGTKSSGHVDQKDPDPSETGTDTDQQSDDLPDTDAGSETDTETDMNTGTEAEAGTETGTDPNNTTETKTNPDPTNNTTTGTTNTPKTHPNIQELYETSVSITIN